MTSVVGAPKGPREHLLCPLVWGCFVFFNSQCSVPLLVHFCTLATPPLHKTE